MSFVICDECGTGYEIPHGFNDWYCSADCAIKELQPKLASLREKLRLATEAVILSLPDDASTCIYDCGPQEYIASSNELKAIVRELQAYREMADYFDIMSSSQHIVEREGSLSTKWKFYDSHKGVWYYGFDSALEAYRAMNGKKD